MDEVLPGILHWATYYDHVGATVHSHIHVPSGSVFDPLLPEGGSVEELGLPTAVLLSNRHHLRSSVQVAEAFGVPIRANELGLYRFEDDADAPRVEGFAFGDEVAEGVHAVQLGALTPEDTVFRLTSADGETHALLFADSLMNPGGELGYVSDDLMGDDPAEVKRGLDAGLRRILEEEAPFDALLFAHGEPIATGGRDALAAFLG
jgi:hypothetical protein